MKSYTDINQSKKLAEILPLESADMYYGYGKDKPEFLPYLDVEIKELCLACWSLAALLGVIKEQGLVDLRFLQSTFDNRANHLTNVWCCTFEDIGTVTLDLYAGNPVDACYEMILKLHDNKLL